MVLAGLFAWLSVAAQAVLIGNWNVANRPNTAQDSVDVGTVAGHLAANVGVPDVWAIQETDTGSTPVMVSALSAGLAGASYAAVQSDSDGGSDRTALIYNTQTVELLSWSTTTTGITHFTTQAEFRSRVEPLARPFFVVSVQLKSGDSSADVARRRDEAGVVRGVVSALDGQDVIVAGDFNWIGSGETGTGVTTNAWNIFTAPGPGQLRDVIDTPGAWRDNPAFLALHSQNPAGPMDDRFDMQLATPTLFDAVGLDYAIGSYTVLGNNGTHSLNGPITTGTGADPSTLAALVRFSDHLPTFARYTVVPEPGIAVFACLIPKILSRRARQANSLSFRNLNLTKS